MRTVCWRMSLAILSFIIAFGVTKAFTNLAAGALTTRFRRKQILVAGRILGIPVPFILAWAPSWSLIVAANVLHLPDPVGPGADLHRPPRRPHRPQTTHRVGDAPAGRIGTAMVLSGADRLGLRPRPPRVAGQRPGHLTLLARHRLRRRRPHRRRPGRHPQPERRCQRRGSPDRSLRSARRAVGLRPPRPLDRTTAPPPRVPGPPAAPRSRPPRRRRAVGEVALAMNSSSARPPGHRPTTTPHPAPPTNATVMHTRCLTGALQSRRGPRTAG